MNNKRSRGIHNQLLTSVTAEDVKLPIPRFWEGQHFEFIYSDDKSWNLEFLIVSAAVTVPIVEWIWYNCYGPTEWPYLIKWL